MKKCFLISYLVPRHDCRDVYIISARLKINDEGQTPIIRSTDELTDVGSKLMAKGYRAVGSNCLTMPSAILSTEEVSTDDEP